MLAKSLKVKPDVTIYDLEDSVAPAQKDTARFNLSTFLTENLNKMGGKYMCSTLVLSCYVEQSHH